ncbi:MAG: type II secretion system F family protein [Anaerolineales bacterium]|nr:type II secretion system F family protein [Anaerolineales bacterium]
MQTLIPIMAGLSLLVIMAGVLTSVRAGRTTAVEERLSRYTGTATEKKIKEKREDRTSILAERLDRAVAGRSFAQNIKAQLSQADIKLRVGEYMTMILLSVFSFGLLSWFLFGKSIFFSVIGLIGGFIAPRMYVTQAAKKRLRDYNNQLGDTLNLWVNALRSGYSVLQAMETISAETAQPVSTEFERVVQEVRLGLTIEQALDNLLTRVPSDDMDLVVTAVNIQREVGGNLADVLSTISHTIRERIRIKGEIAVLTAQATVSGYIISLLPIALTLFLRMSNPDYINELFYREAPWVFPDVVPCGWLVIMLGLILIFSGFMTMRKIADIDI